jgi:hypothetical protein
MWNLKLARLPIPPHPQVVAWVLAWLSRSAGQKLNRFSMDGSVAPDPVDAARRAGKPATEPFDGPAQRPGIPGTLPRPVGQA